MIVDVHTGDTMQVHLQLGFASLLALLDSGSTHNFIFKKTTQGGGHKLECRGSMKVTVANSDRVPYLGMLCRSAWSNDAESFDWDFFSLPLATTSLGPSGFATLGPSCGISAPSP